MKDPAFWLVFLGGIVVGVVGMCLLLALRGVHPPIDDVQLPTVAPVVSIGGVA